MVQFGFQVLLELCTSVMPLLLSFTLLADWNGLFVALLVAAVVGLAYHSHAASMPYVHSSTKIETK